MTLSRRGLLGGVPGAALLGCAQTRSAWRGEPPESAEAIEVAMPVYHRLDAPDGTEVILAPRPGAAVVGLQLVLDAGSRHDPRDRPGLAVALSHLLPEGTGGTGRAELAAAFGDLGGDLEVQTAYDALTIATRVLAPSAASALALLVDVALHPTLAADRAGETRILVPTPIAVRAPVEQLARDAAIAELTGLPPSQGAGQFTESSSRDITLSDTRVLLEAAVARKPRAILVAGGFDPEVARGWIGDALAALPRLVDASPPEATHPPRARRDAIVLVDRPGDEAAISLAVPAAEVNGADEVRRELTSQMLLGRLWWELREEQGITYDVDGETRPTRAGRVHTISLRLRPGDVGRALATTMLALRSTQSMTISSDAVQRTRTRLFVNWMDRFQTTAGLLAGAHALAVHGWPADHYRRLPKALHEVSGLEVSRALRRHFDPRMVHIAVAAPADLVRPAIEKAVLAPVRVVDPATLA